MNLVQPVDLSDDDDDDHLIERIVATGDPQVFKVLYDKYSRAIDAQLCAWVRSRQIEDVAQETWAKIYENLEKCWPGDFERGHSPLPGTASLIRFGDAGRPCSKRAPNTPIFPGKRRWSDREKASRPESCARVFPSSRSGIER
jgi:hypothetical protein